MVDQRDARESGTTLVELLVVMVLLTVVGLITTTGVVQGLRALTTSQATAVTLDESRLTIQRVRDVIRGGTAVCPDSVEASLKIWTDRNDEGSRGVFEDEEWVVFEVLDDRLTRRDSSGAAVLISDAIVNLPTEPVFQYPSGGQPADQAPELCTLDQEVDASAVETSQVRIDLRVDNPGDGADLTAATTVQLRNAGLRGLSSPATGTPTADIQVVGDCLVVGQTCTFDGSGSSDPEGGSLSYAWYIDDPDVTGDEDVLRPTDPDSTSFAHMFADDGSRAPTVVLVVADEEGKTDSAQITLTLTTDTDENDPPLAAFTFQCSGAICDFEGDGSQPAYENSSDAQMSGSYDPDGDIRDYDWTISSSPSVPDPPNASNIQVNFTGVSSATITLTVTDSADHSSTSSSVKIKPTPFTYRLEELWARNGGDRDNVQAYATVVVTTTSDFASDNLEVTFQIEGGSDTTDSCTTDSAGTCTVGPIGASNSASSRVTFTVSTVLPKGAGVGVYDPVQNKVEDSVTVGKNDLSRVDAGPARGK